VSSEDEQPTIRHRRRIRLTDDAPREETAPDPFNPGPMINYAPLPLGPDGLPVPPELRQRIRDLRALDRRAARELILRTLHAFLIAHRPMDEIARAFGVSVREVYKWRVELNKRMAAEFKAKNPLDLLVEQIAHYGRAKAYSWQQASRAEDHADKCRWVNTALKAEAQISDLYTRVGLIDASAYKPAQTADEDTDNKAAVLSSLAQKFLEGNYTKEKAKKGKAPTTEQDAVGDVDDHDFLL
jgi:hypothetical protein